MYSIRLQPLSETDTKLNIIDDLSLYQALMLARNTALAEKSAVDIYFDDTYHITIMEA